MPEFTPCCPHCGALPAHQRLFTTIDGVSSTLEADPGRITPAELPDPPKRDLDGEWDDGTLLTNAFDAFAAIDVGNAGAVAVVSSEGHDTSARFCRLRTANEWTTGRRCRECDDATVWPKDPSDLTTAEVGRVTVYVDGSRRANGDGGWAWWANPSTFASGAERFTTNNAMELWAAIEAIGAFNPDVELEVVSDSAYVVGCFHERWFDDWRARGWRNSRREPVANRDLWEELLAAVESHRAPITWTHTRGHGKAGHSPEHRHGNDQADRLATAASAALSS